MKIYFELTTKSELLIRTTGKPSDPIPVDAIEKIRKGYFPNSSEYKIVSKLDDKLEYKLVVYDTDKDLVFVRR